MFPRGYIKKKLFFNTGCNRRLCNRCLSSTTFLMFYGGIDRGHWLKTGEGTWVQTQSSKVVDIHYCYNLKIGK